MSTYEVTVIVTITVQSNDFQSAASLAKGIIDGSKGKPDSAGVINAVVSQVTAQ